MGKKKERKKTDDEIRIINTVKSTVNACSAKYNFVRSIDFYEKTNEDSLRFEATLDCGTFEEKIVYYPVMLFSEHCIDVELTYKASDYTYSFYDIFNLFDIDDFNLYYYRDLISSTEVENSVREIFSATEKHLYYLEKAQEHDYLPELEKNYETDMKHVYETEDWKEDLEFDDECFFVHGNHPVVSLADGQINEKAIKKLKRKNDKDKLDTIYEQRLLKYIEDGNEVNRSNLPNEKIYKPNEKTYNEYKRKIFAPIAAALFIVILVAVLIAHKAVFFGAQVPQQTFTVFGLHGLQLPYLKEIVLSFIAAIALYGGIQLSFGKKIIHKFAPDDLKEHISSRLEAELNGKVKPKRPLTLAIIFIVTLIIAAVLSYVAIADIGFYDSKVKFFDDDSLGIYTVEYEEAVIYKLREISSDKDYIEAENAYAISDGNGHYYELGEVAPNSNLEGRLFEIAEKYNKEIKEINSVEDIK